MPSTHLILGGSGFIGRHAAILLARLGHRVVLASRYQPVAAFPAEIAGAITWTRCDMVSTDWATLIRQADVIHHYAWSTIPATANADPEADLAANVQPVLALLEAMRRRPAPPRLVFISSGGTVYGRLEQVPVHENHRLAPITAYGAGKAAVELYCSFYRGIHGLDCRVARLSNPYGAGQDFTRGQGAATTFLHLALTGRPITIWGDGTVVRDYIHIADAAAGLVALALAPPGDEFIFNIASGAGVSLNEVVAEITAHLGREVVVQRKPGRAFDIPVSILDIARARAAFGWAPRLSFAAGMARTLDDVRRRLAFSTLDEPAEIEAAMPHG
jgi:UDP-glucose 4-epimerase